MADRDVMRERIARAIRDNVKCDATGLAPAVASVYLVGFEEAADAVLAEMREPTKAMVKAATALDWGAKTDPTWPEYWAAMIDAARGETGA